MFRRIVSAVVLALILAGTLPWTLNIRQIKANPGSVTIKVQDADGCPRSNADVRIKKIGGPTYLLGLTDENGTITRCDLNLSSGTYQAFAYYPYPTQFDGIAPFEVNETGDGTATITADYPAPLVTVTVLFADGYPVEGALVKAKEVVVERWLTFGYTNHSGQVEDLSGWFTEGLYTAYAYYPDTVTLFGSSSFFVDSYGKGNTTIRGSYERPCVTIKVQYLDGHPRSDAIVIEQYTQWIGVTDENGYVSATEYFEPNSLYVFRAYWPDLGHQFGPQETIITNGNGDGSTTIQADYEIAPPAIEILSPANVTYINTSLPLNFTVYDFSSISWIGYSLDNQANVTITGNTTLTNLPIGQHSIIVYANDTYGNMGSSNKIYFTIANDIAITNVTPTKTIVGQGYSTTMNVTIENQGAYAVTFNITAYANSTVIGTITNITLTNGTSTTTTFTWNTTDFAKGNYTISAYAWPVMGETDTEDNRLPDGTVYVGVPGDFVGQGYPPPRPPDGKVDFNDQMCFVDAFFAKYGIPPPPGVNPANCDLTGPSYPPLKTPDGAVDFNDQMCFVDCFFAQYGIPPPW